MSRATTYSEYALFPDRPELLHQVVHDASAARDAGIPHGTTKADDWGFQWVKRFAQATSNAWMRANGGDRKLNRRFGVSLSGHL